MARPEVTGRRIAASGDPAVLANADAYSIEEFCQRHRISVQLFYKMKHQMPATFRVGTRVLISREAAARWRLEREKAST